MQEDFAKWLVQEGKLGAAKTYPGAINKISKHYSKETGAHIDIYSASDQVLVSEIAHDYSKNGRFSHFGNGGHGLFRAAIGRYAEFFAQKDKPDLPPPPPTPPSPSPPIEGNFAYEKDLQTSISAHISDLFPGYDIFGGNSIGIEYSIEGKKIDLLLEEQGSKDLLAIELKAGIADCKVFGQITMYIGMLRGKFPDRGVRGIIIAGGIDPGLKHACSTTDLVKIKVYRMSVELDDA